MAHIKAVVERDGGATVGCEQLRILRPDALSSAEKFKRIGEIARRDGWSFAFLPDGSVHFGSYAKRT